MEKDSRTLWNSIDWQGKYREQEIDDRPAEEAFQRHMENLLNPPGVQNLQDTAIESNVNVPLLDSPFTPQEFSKVIDDQLD